MLRQGMQCKLISSHGMPARLCLYSGMLKMRGRNCIQKLLSTATVPSSPVRCRLARKPLRRPLQGPPYFPQTYYSEEQLTSIPTRWCAPCAVLLCTSPSEPHQRLIVRGGSSPASASKPAAAETQRAHRAATSAAASTASPTHAATAAKAASTETLSDFCGRRPWRACLGPR
jgi:hypothetical protein